MITTDGIGRGRVGWGRNKRWEYWGVTTPTHVIALVLSDIDYAAVHGIWVLDRQTGEEVSHDAIGVLGRSATLPGTLGDGPARARTRKVRIDVEEIEHGTRLRASGARVRVDITAHRPAGHESLGVVVPWSDRLFQYTVKDVARPAVGTLWVDGCEYGVPAGESWAVLDHGRGRWPYSMHWNWGAGSGRRPPGGSSGSRSVARGPTAPACRRTRCSSTGTSPRSARSSAWHYDTDDWLAPWRVTGETVDLVFTPFHLKQSVTDLKLFSSRTHQCFGHWSGRVRDDRGSWVDLEGLVGWAEDVRNRW